MISRMCEVVVEPFEPRLPAASQRVIPEDPNDEERQNPNDQPEEQGTPARDVNSEQTDPDETAKHDAPDRG